MDRVKLFALLPEIKYGIHLCNFEVAYSLTLLQRKEHLNNEVLMRRNEDLMNEKTELL
jgi:hypothetical protein